MAELTDQQAVAGRRPGPSKTSIIGLTALVVLVHGFVGVELGG